MTFMIVLLALFIERVLQQYRPQRQHSWFDGYCRYLTKASLAQSLMARPWGTAIVLLPPLLLVAWLHTFFTDLGSPFALIFGVVVLLYSLGPQDLGDQAEAFMTARDDGQQAAAGQIAEALCLGEAPHTEPGRSYAVARAVVVLAAQRLAGPVFWFVVFGPVGAAAYRAIHLLAEHLQGEDCPEGMKRYSDEMRHIADWAPARVTAAGYAIAGNFDAVAHAWRTFDYAPGAGPLAEAEHLLAHAGLAALDTFPEDTAEPDEVSDPSRIPPVVEDALALVWRSLAVWVTVIAGGSLVAALA